MVSEVNMVSGLSTGSAAGLTQMRNGPVPVPSAFHWRSSRPGRGSPTPRALPTLAHTHPVAPGLCFQRTPGLLRCSGGNVRGTIWGKTGDWQPCIGWGGVWSVLEQGFLRCSDAEGTICRPQAACTWVLGPGSAASFSPGPFPRSLEPGRLSPSTEYTSTQRRFQCPIPLSRLQHTLWQEQQAETIVRAC